MLKKIGLVAAGIAVLFPAYLAAETSSTFTSQPEYPVCVQLTYNLKLGNWDGNTNGEVSMLQRFLVGKGILGSFNVTGTFGPLTETALKLYQSQMGIVSSGTPGTTGYGAVGAQTRAMIAQDCGTAISPIPVVSIDPYAVARGEAVNITVRPRQQARAEAWGGNSVTITLDTPTTSGAMCATVQVVVGTQGGYSYTNTPCFTNGAMTKVGLRDRNGKYAEIGVTPRIQANGQIMLSMQLATQPTSNSIKVTAPNGGERWELGVTNSVTWNPYDPNAGVNPSKDVSAYLQVYDCARSADCFNTLGRVQESGKASIHWTTGELNSATEGGRFAPPGGQYFILLRNNVTGATDRSDAPFTLLPKPIDLKLNGSDGPISLSAGVPITATWTSTGTVSCRLDNGYDVPNPTVYPIPAFDNMRPSGSVTIYVPQQQNWYVNLVCKRADGSYIYDSVVVNAGTAAATLQITSPNGGEQVPVGTQFNVRATHSGLKSMSVALYKNDQWKSWIQRDLAVSGSGPLSIGWIPTAADADAAGNVYKIYITGQKADGSGYIEDKSDAPFSLSASTTQPGGTLVADPSSGTAPLSVRFTSAAPQPSQTFRLDFGDGTFPGTPVRVPCAPQGYCPQLAWTSHTYTTPGTYTAKTICAGISCPAQSTTRVTVTGGTVPAAGTLSITTDSSTPPYSLVAAGSQNVAVSSFRYKATGESIRLERVGLTLVSDTASTNDITRATIWNGATQVGTAIFAGSNITESYFSQPVVIQQNSEAVLTIKVDISNIGVGQSGRSGDLIRIFSTTARGTGVTSGLTISVTQLNSGAETVPGVRMFKTFPTVRGITLPSNALLNGQNRLLRFAISANAAGHVGLRKFAFSSSGAAVSDWKLYGYSDVGYSTPIAQYADGLLGTATTYSAAVIEPSQPVQVPAGQTYYFELRGNVSLQGAETAVATKLIGDSVPSSPIMNATAIGNFVWSPNSLTTSPTTAADWTNSYGIPGFPSSGISQLLITGQAPTPVPVPNPIPTPTPVPNPGPTPVPVPNPGPTPSSATLSVTVCYPWNTTNCSNSQLSIPATQWPNQAGVFWSATGVKDNSCKMDGPNAGNVHPWSTAAVNSTPGWGTGEITARSTYTLTCTDLGGTIVTKSVVVSPTTSSVASTDERLSLVANALAALQAALNALLGR